MHTYLIAFHRKNNSAQVVVGVGGRGVLGAEVGSMSNFKQVLPSTPQKRVFNQAGVSSLYLGRMKKERERMMLMVRKGTEKEKFACLSLLSRRCLVPQLSVRCSALRFVWGWDGSSAWDSPNRGSPASGSDLSHVFSHYGHRIFISTGLSHRFSSPIDSCQPLA